MLTLGNAVFTAHAHEVIAVAVLLQIRQLEVQGFLYAKHQGMLVQDHGGGCLAAVGPNVVSVIGRSVADIIGHYFDRGRLFLVAGCEQGQKGCQKKGDFFHDLG